MAANVKYPGFFQFVVGFVAFVKNFVTVRLEAGFIASAQPNGDFRCGVVNRRVDQKFRIVCVSRTTEVCKDDDRELESFRGMHGHESDLALIKFQRRLFAQVLVGLPKLLEPPQAFPERFCTFFIESPRQFDREVEATVTLAWDRRSGTSPPVLGVHE